MIKRIAVFLMMGHLLFGAIVLPLGDFSLMKELPGMYRAYAKVVSPEDKGVFDFVGDYLLNGKDLLGHNQHDQPSKSTAFQFQHPAVFAVIIHPAAPLSTPVQMPAMSILNAVYLSAAPSDYHPTLLRPPLA
ncbi:hypothetical protein C8P68_10768 [Mucilaginibacter yixingensis]|uniref:Uncharacterized protein n=1 Tax=Mucilaginibacter yixingensis TaxID=1295612 RepID=A0A2T5J638_9SPHI|nr:hypothetical protein [Mucilaginibacter yixingensis]PTQ94007.1 hypothetical protein C8P68_10768 [Mucilaginibacter yixingensis]